MSSISKKFQRAQVNVARMIDTSIDDPNMLAFREVANEVNELAEGCKGFIWKNFFDDNAPASDSNQEKDAPVIINFSVWQDVTTLKNLPTTRFMQQS